VPWSNKELQISYESFRDKTLPGSEEKWKVKISGYKKEKVAAEMLATMYDASLDQFQPHSWIQPSLWPHYYALQRWDGNKNFSQVQAEQKWLNDNSYKSFDKRYDNLIGSQIRSRYNPYSSFPIERDKGILMNAKLDTVAFESLSDPNKITKYRVVAAEPTKNGDIYFNNTEKAGKTNSDNTNIQIRKNFNETAFFFPDLRTDSSGSIEFSFTMPEALTKWKFMALAHTKDLAFGSSTKEIVTQKELMVQPNMPRFLREGDRLEFSAKIVNLSDTEITGQAELQLMDAATNQPVDGWFKNAFPNQYFTVAAGQSDVVLFPIEVPYQFNTALTWRIVARAGNKSDGEEDALPVLTNRMLVTESLPIGMRGTGTKNFTFTKLLNSGSSETLKSQSLTVEYTSNPAWY
ncbi:MAG: alpha-2-macroglobulin, partial [Bacteroidetes bacterium]|nr:alpha-2-macroglobulin [Bacteroidota bacterium]